MPSEPDPGAGKGPTSPVIFRCAQASDARLLTEIALAGKQYWGYPAEWIDWWRYDLVVTPEYIRREPVRVAECSGAVVGFCGLSASEEGRQLEHMWLRRDCIGRGFGRLLFDEAIRLAREEGVRELRINSDPNAEAFYLKMGALRIGLEVYHLPGAIRREVPLLVYSVPA
jgi:GNAT superfamily N-acetyltransferase